MARSGASVKGAVARSGTSVTQIDQAPIAAAEAMMRGKHILRPVTALEAIPEAMAEEIILEQLMSTGNAPAPVTP